MSTQESPTLIQLLEEQNQQLIGEKQLLQEGNSSLQIEQNKKEGHIEELNEKITKLENDMISALELIEQQKASYAALLDKVNNLENLIANKPTPPAIEGRTSALPIRSIMAPSKVLAQGEKKKDNRLLELKKITKEHMNVSDEEAALRLYRLQREMAVIISNLKEYMKGKGQDTTKTWKTVPLNTQRFGFEMVEKEAEKVGVPLNMCINNWGSRRLVSKSWANARRVTKKTDTIVKVHQTQDQTNDTVNNPTNDIANNQTIDPSSEQPTETEDVLMMD